MRCVCVSQLLEIYFAFAFNRIDCVQENAISKFHLTVKIDFVEVVYYLKQLLHLLHNKSVTSADSLLSFPLIL